MGRADNYSLLLLAGGKSSRMGTNKAELLYEGKSFLENIIEKAKCLGLKELYISGYQGKYEDVQVVYDIYPEIGPLGGLHAVLTNVQTQYCLVLPIDIPQIPLAFLDELIKIHEQGTIDMEIPLLVEREGFLEPLIGIYPVTMKNFIEERIDAGNFSVFRMIKEWGYVGVQTEIPEWQIANINTKEDYKRLLK